MAKNQFVRKVVKTDNILWALTDKTIYKCTGKKIQRYNIKLKNNYEYYFDKNYRESVKKEIITDWTEMISGNDVLFLYKSDTDSTALILEIKDDKVHSIPIYFDKNIIFTLLNAHYSNNMLWLHFAFLDKNSNSKVINNKYEAIYCFQDKYILKYYSFNSEDFNSCFFMRNDNKYVVFSTKTNNMFKLVLTDITNIDNTSTYLLDSTLTDDYDCSTSKLINDTLCVVSKSGLMLMIDLNNISVIKTTLPYFNSQYSCYEFYGENILYNDLHNFYLFNSANNKNEVLKNLYDYANDFYLKEIIKIDNFFYLLFDWNFYNEHRWNLRIIEMNN